MIITVTMNPAIDKTAEIPDFVLGGLNEMHEIIIDAGGKGINVSKTLRVLNKPNMAIAFLGGAMGELVKAELKKQMILTDFVPVKGETRCNLKVNTVFGMTELNEPGPTISQEELNQLMTRLKLHGKSSNMFILSGSVPNGVPTDIYKTMIEFLHGCGCKVFLDTNGEALKLGLAAGPDYVKPNLKELRDLFDYHEEFASTEDMVSWVKDKIRIIHEQGPKLVVVSLGADGAVFSDGFDMVYEPAKKIEVLSPVGAGDAMTAAIAYGLDSGMFLQEIIRYAMAASAGACMTPGTKPPAKDVVVQLLRQ